MLTCINDDLMQPTDNKIPNIYRPSMCLSHCQCFLNVKNNIVVVLSCQHFLSDELLGLMDPSGKRHVCALRAHCS